MIGHDRHSLPSSTAYDPVMEGIPASAIVEVTETESTPLAAGASEAGTGGAGAAAADQAFTAGASTSRRPRPVGAAAAAVVVVALVLAVVALRSGQSQAPAAPVRGRATAAARALPTSIPGWAVGTWSSVAPFATQGIFHTGVINGQAVAPFANQASFHTGVSNGHIYALVAEANLPNLRINGNADPPVAVSSFDFGIYDAKANTWTHRMSKPPVPCPLFSGASAPGRDGRIYYFGCSKGAILVYDPAKNAWAVAPGTGPMPDGVSGAALGPVGRIYLAGWFFSAPVSGPASKAPRQPGLDALLKSGGLGAYRGVAAYTPGTTTWTFVAPAPHFADLADEASSIGLVGNADGRLYLIGGEVYRHTGVPHAPCPCNYVEAYTPGTDTWTELPPPPIGRQHFAATADHAGHVFIIGGQTDPTVLGSTSVQAYLPSSTTWTTLPPLSRPQWLSVVATTAPDDSVYLLGPNVAEVYRPRVGTSSKPRG